MSLGDTKKKDLVGDFKNGDASCNQRAHRFLRLHDFLGKKIGKAIPYGVYDLMRNERWVNVGTDHDTAAEKESSICGWL